MLALLVLAVVASASAIPLGDKKILPIYENPLSYRTMNEETILRSWCVDDCHHHILEKPVFIMMKNADSKYDMHYMPFGLNSLGKSPLTMPVKHYLMSDNKVAMISPLAKFPFELFPGVADLDIFTPEHSHKLNSFYKEAPVMVIFPEQDFAQFNQKKGLSHLADLAMDDLGFHLVKDLAQLRTWSLPQDAAPVRFPTGRQFTSEVPIIYRTHELPLVHRQNPLYHVIANQQYNADDRSYVPWSSWVNRQF